MRLRPLAAADLAVVSPWFDDPGTRRWLGGREWPAQSLALAGPLRPVLCATDGGALVGLLDCEIHADGRAGFALVVDPARRRLGHGRRMVEALRAGLPQVSEFFVGVERGNAASRGLALRTGFVPVTGEDTDGFTYFAWRRHGSPEVPWSLPEA